MSEQAEPVRAIGFQIAGALVEHRQITFNGFVTEDMTDEEANSAIDRVMRLMDRQRAFYTLEQLNDERVKLVETLDRAEQDFAEVEKRFEREQSEIDSEALNLNAEANRIESDASTNGRHGPVGINKTKVVQNRARVKELRATKEKRVNERAEHRGNALLSITRFRESIAETDRRIVKAQALIEGK